MNHVWLCTVVFCLMVFRCSLDYGLDSVNYAKSAENKTLFNA